MVVSFIIPHKGREELLGQTIQSILDLEFDLKEVEIIVVSQNTTLEDIHRFQEIHPIQTVFRPEHETISALRNIGVKNASGDYLVFLDADIQLSHNWLKVMFEEFNAVPERVLVSATQRCPPNANQLEQIRVALNSSASNRYVEFLDGRDLFLTRETFEKAGGFPEHLVTCEDYYFTHKVHQLGKLYCTSRTSYIHLGEDKTYREMFRKEIWRGQSNLQSLKGRKIPLREVPSFLVLFWMLFFLLSLIVSLFWKKMFTLGGASFALLMLPIFLYSLRLYHLGKGTIPLGKVIQFYGIYFPARIIGILGGFFKIITF